MRLRSMAAMMSLVAMGVDINPRTPDNNPMTKRPSKGALPVLREQLAKLQPGSNRYKKIADRIRKNGGVVE